METLPVSFRVVEGQEINVFSQYLLPMAASLARSSGDEMRTLGAVWGAAACGAAVLRLWRREDDAPLEAELLSFYIDPLVRRKGVGLGLLSFCLKQAALAGAGVFRAYYAAEGEILAALDALMRKKGLQPAFHLPVYEMDSMDYHDAPLLRAAFSWKYRRPEHIVTLSALTKRQRDHLYRHPELPGFLHPSGVLGLDPDLSVAYLCDGTPEGIWLGGSSANGCYSLMGVWHSDAAPLSCFHELILAHLNLCWYHGGGEFRYYVSPSMEFADRLIQKYTQGKYRRLEEHLAVIGLDAPDGG